MHVLRSRHTPFVLSFALFGLLVWWTNTPKRPNQDAWLSEYRDASKPYVLELKADLFVDALAYDHITVSDTLSHHVGLLAMALPDVTQESRLDGYDLGAGSDALAYRASLRLRFGSRAQRNAFALALEQQHTLLQLQDQQAVPGGMYGRAALNLDIPGSDARLKIQDIDFQVLHAEDLGNA